MMMNIIDRFMQQHLEIVGLCEELKLYATGDYLQKDTTLAYKVQLNLNEILSLHLQFEDHSLYPLLLEDKDPNIKNTALRLQEEVGSVTLAHTTYQKKYASQESIDKDIFTYADETQRLIALILERIQKEEVELYSLLR